MLPIVTPMRVIGVRGNGQFKRCSIIDLTLRFPWQTD